MGSPKPSTVWEKMPKFIARAFQHIKTPEEVGDFISKDGPISYRVNGHDILSNDYSIEALNSGNHAFYFGKTPVISATDAILERIGFRSPDRGTYNAEIFQVAAQYAQAILEPGQKVRFVIASRLSASFNGPHSLDKHLTTEQEKALIKKQALKAGLKEDQLEIVAIEELPVNQPLFEVLTAEETKAQTEQRPADYLEAIIGGAMMQKPLPKALEIAGLISLAAKRNPKFMANLAATQPRSLRESEEMSDENKTAYAITELAIRINDLLEGRIVQGGVDRQKRYDHFIWEFIKGEKGQYKAVGDLQRLFEMLEGKELHTLHIKQKNHQQKKLERNIAQTRIGIWTTLAAAAALAIALAGRSAGEEEGRQAGITEGRAAGLVEGKQQGREQYLGDLQGAADQYIANNFRDKQFRFESAWAGEAQNVPTVKRFAAATLDELKLRYNITEEFLQTIQPLVVQFLVQHQDYLPAQMYPWGWDNYKFLFFADKFYQDNPVLFAANGYADRIPYEDLINYVMEDPLDSNIDIQLNIAELNNYQYLGTISNPGFYAPVKLYAVATSGGKIRVAILDEQGFETTGLLRLTDENIPKLKEGVRQDRECHSVLSLRFQHEDLINKAVGTAWDSDPALVLDIPADDFYIKPLPDLVDNAGTVIYQLAIYSRFNEKRMLIEKFLLARRPGETNYTTSAGKLAAQEIETRLYPWKNHPSP